MSNLPGMEDPAPTRKTTKRRKYAEIAARTTLPKLMRSCQQALKTQQPGKLGIYI